MACAGQNAHGSTPEEGHNAQTALVAALAALPLADCPLPGPSGPSTPLFPHGDHRGTALGIAQADDLSGPLTLAFTMLTLNDTGCTGRFDSRTPSPPPRPASRPWRRPPCGLQALPSRATWIPPLRAGERPFPPHPGPVLRGLHRPKGQCLAIGGGTYVHDIPGGVAFGPNMPGFVSNLHGPDEKIRVADLLTTAKIYAQVMVALCL